MVDAMPRMADREVYEQFAPELIKFATGLVGSQDAEDVLGSAIVRAFSSASWPTVTEQRAYLYRAVLNQANDHRRRRAQRPAREAASAFIRTVESPSVDPEVRAAVDRLSLRQRAVVLLTYWADQSPAETANLLGISEGSVRRHLARARAHLRSELSD